MEYKTILVSLGHDAGCQARIRMAAELAARFQGHLLGLSATGVRLDPPSHAVEDAVHLAELSRRKLLAHAAASGELLGETVKEVAHGTPFTHQVVEEEAGQVLAQEGRVADLIVLGGLLSRDDGMLLSTAEYVLLNAGRPVLLVPPHPMRLHGGHVVIAWDDSREAARAVADALPLLLCASRVTILSVWDQRSAPDANSEPVAGLRRFLQRHGIVAAARTEQSGAPVGDVILDALPALGAEMLVAGGYGHARMREMILGGTTRSLMRYCPVPLLISH